MIFTWTIAQLERNAADNFVVTCHYRVNAVDGDYSAETYGTVSYTQTAEDFVPFEEVTEAIVVGWVKESLSEATIEDALTAQIELQKTPVILTGLPWQSL